MKLFTPLKRPVACLLAVAALQMVTAHSASASAVSYALTLCEDYSVLTNPTNPIIAQNAALKSQHTLMLQRTNPYFEIKNTSEDALLTQLVLTIGDTTKNFDWASKVETSPGVTVSILQPDSVAGNVRSDQLVINFNGLLPGAIARFRIGLAPDSDQASAILDYREVLFRMNSNDTSNNAVSTVTFSNADGEESLTKKLPNWVNPNRFTSTNLDVLTTSCGLDSVTPFTMTDEGFIPTPPVPEPGSFALLASGLLALAMGWRQGKRRAA
jgi:hypothetical protein